jgi:FecR-like protein/outer membrane protein with beta-barrel domain
MKRLVTREVGASLCISTALLSTLSTEPVRAQTNIGSAVQIERNVLGTFAGRTRSLATGDGVLANENIKTENASAAQLRFLDQSSLTIGPSSSVILDRFVFSPDRVAREGTVQMSSGAARWIGGSAQSDSYKVQTPHAVIGMRGTAFDLLVEASRTFIVLREGTIVVCLVRNRQRCITVSTPGSVVVVTATEIRGPTPVGPSSSQFADNCLSPVNRRLSFCTTQAFSESLNTNVRTAGGQATDAWTGFYAGGNIGYSWGNVDNTITVAPFTQVNPFGFVFPGGSSSAQVKPDGFIGGLQFGYSWRLAPRWLAGIEADLQASGQKGSALGVFSGTTTNCSFAVCTFTNTTDITAKLSWFGTVRGRAGIEQSGLWFYGTGGMAYGRVSVSGTNTFYVADASNPATAVIYSTPFSYSVTKVGWVVGAGVEGRLSVRQWTWKIEYLHMDLGSIGGGSFANTPSINIVPSTAPIAALSSSKFTDEIVRIGINYQLSP